MGLTIPEYDCGSMPAADTKPIRILLVEDHIIVRAGLRMLIESRAGIEVVGETGALAESVSLARQEQPDIILLDLDMGGQSSLDILPELLAAGRARVIILTGVRDPEAHRQAVRLGAVGLVLKEHATEVLLKAIEKVQSGEVWLDRSMTANVLGELSRRQAIQDLEAPKIATLTPREREVIALIGEGLRNREIGARLFITESTVRHHLTSIFDKLGLSDRFELAIYAYRHGLAAPPR